MKYISRYLIIPLVFTIMLSGCHAYAVPMIVVSVAKIGSFLKATLPAIALEKGVDKLIEWVDSQEWFEAEDIQANEQKLKILPLPNYPLHGYPEEAMTIKLTGKRDGRTYEQEYNIPNHYLKFERPSLDCNDCWRLTAESALFIANRHKVASVQMSLQDLGYKLGRIDGINGTKTKNAIKAFQETRSDLQNSGLLDDKTLEALIID